MEVKFWSDKLLDSQIHLQEKKLAVNKEDHERLMYLDLLLKEKKRRENLPPKKKK